MCTFRYVHLLPTWLPKCRKPFLKWSRNLKNRVFQLSLTVPETTMKINVENVWNWEPQGCLNGLQNHRKINEKTHLVVASAAKPDFDAPGNIWGYPPCRKMVQKHIKKRVRQQRKTWSKFPNGSSSSSCSLLPVSTCQGVSVFVLQVPHVVFPLFYGVMSGNHILR